MLTRNMDLKTSTEKLKSSPRQQRLDKLVDETSNAKCSSEECSKSVTDSEYFVHYECNSGSATTKSSLSHNEPLVWPELKAALDNTKHLDDKHKGAYRCCFFDKNAIKSHTNIHSQHDCLSERDLQKAVLTQRSEAESYVHNELFERKMYEMRELYDMRIKQLHDKLDRANQINQMMKAHVSKMKSSMFEIQKDNTSLRRIVKNLSKINTASDSENLQRIQQLENYLLMCQRKCQAESAKLKELQNLQSQHENDIRNMETAHSEKILSMMNEYKSKLDNMEKSYMSQMSNLEAEHQEILSERDNEIKRLQGDLNQQYLKMEHEIIALRSKKNSSEAVLKELEVQLKTSEKKKEDTLRFVEGAFMKDFTELVTENHSLKMLMLKHSSEAWSCIFHKVVNFTKEVDKVNGDCEKIANVMEMKINNLRDGRHEMGDYQENI